MKNLIEKNAARIIITTLIALIIVGIAIGAGIPYNVDNYDPGHSILEIGNEFYYFGEDDWKGTSPKKFLTLDLIGNDEYAGRLDIRPGEGDGIVIRQGGDYGSRDPGLFLRSLSDHAQLNFYPGVQNAIPNQLSVYVDKVVIPSGIELCLGGQGTTNCISDFSEIIPSTGKEPDMTFMVWNPDLTTWACTARNLDDYCGDSDGCRITLLMQHELEPDQVRVIDEHIYMEESSVSNNNTPGVYGWTRQEGGGDRAWQTGSNNTVRETMFAPWDWVYMQDFISRVCPGRTTDSPTYDNPYRFNFRSHPHVTTRVIIKD